MKYTIQGVIAIMLLSLTSTACFTGKANVRVTRSH